MKTILRFLVGLGSICTSIAQVPTITSFSPTSGLIGTSVTFTGTNFSATASNNIVYFGATRATVTTSSTTQVVATVPLGATYSLPTITIGGKIGYAPVPFIVKFSNTGGIVAGSFATQIQQAAGSAPLSATAIGDFDNDGKSDLAVITSGTIAVLLNTTSAPGTITFSTMASLVLTSNTNYVDLVAADFDGDGKLDLAESSASAGSGTIDIFLNTTASTGTITFSKQLPSISVVAPYVLGKGDIDGDGRVDLVATQVSVGTNNVYVFRNITAALGTITFNSTPTNLATGNYDPEGVFVMDLDGDRKPEVLATAPGNSIGNTAPTGILNIFYNTSPAGGGTVSFLGAVQISTGTGPQSVSAGDLDLDGKPDIVVANYVSSTLQIWQNNSTQGSFSAGSVALVSTLGVSSNVQELNIADLNGDGRPDVIGTEWNGNAVSVFQNNSTSGSFAFGTERIFAVAGPNPRFCPIGDIDGDGKLDMVVSQNSTNVSILRNTQAAPLPTNQPTGLSLSNITATSINGNFTIATGTPSGYIVLRNTVVVADIPASGSTYSVGQVLGASKVVYSGTANTFVDSPLSSSTTYYYAVFSFNGSGSTINYLTTSPLTGTATSLAVKPTAQVTNLIFSAITSNTLTLNLTNGNGSSRIALARAGLGVNASPVDGTTYSISNTFGTGSQIGSGNYVVGSGTGPFNITGLNPGITYYFQLFEFNGSGGTENYFLNVATGNPNSVATQPPAPSASAATAIGATSFSANWSASTGATGYLVDVSTSASFLSYVTGFNGLSVGNVTTYAVNTNLAASTTYYYRVRASNTSGISTNSGTISLTTAAGPGITNFNPTSGVVGAIVTITGTNFDSTPANNIVKFNGTTATVTASTATSIATSVPTGATTGTITVTVSGQTGTSLTSFTVVPAPTITSFNPTSGGVLTTVTITGTNFDTTPANNTVKFNGTATVATASTATSITTSVPTGATTGTITVTVNGQTATSATSFTVLPAPTITSFNPTSGGVGTPVTITGTNFDVTATNNVVKFNGTTALITGTPTATSIVTSVPSGAASGNITATVNGQTASSTTSFTVIPSPTITNFTPGTGLVGATVTITGTNFSTTPANNTVKFNGTIATITGTPTATSIVTTVPTGATTGTITVTVSGVTVTSSTSFTVITDTTPTVVSSNNTPNSVAPNTAISVSANLTDPETGIATAKVLYRPIAGALPNNFTSLDMTLTGPSYLATIPLAAVTELGVEYKYLAVNGAGLDNTASQTLYKTVINHSSGLTISSYPGSAAGKTATSYRIIAIPLVLQSKTANNVFNNVLGGYDPTIWRMFRYNGSNFGELNGNSVLVPGEGYFFICVSSSPLNTGPGTTVDVSTSSSFIITLNPGWNQIGNPYNFNISWADVVAANPSETANLGGNTSKIRTFRGTVENVDVLKTFEGGFVKYLGTAAANIKIPVAKNASIQGRVGSTQSISTNSLDQPSWEILFNLKAGDMQYNLGGLGMRPDAKEGFDYYDDFNAPRFIDYMEIKFPKKYVGMTYTKDVVPTNENFVWQFNVESNLKDEVTSLNWDNSYFGSGKEIYLLDVTTQRITNMNIESSYEFNRITSKEFKVVYGSSDYVKKEIIPDQVILFDPSPNPFTDRVTIEYSLPKEAETLGGEIEIHNILGSKISSVSTPKQSGAGKWVWESEGQAQGFYLVRLKVGDGVVTKKIWKK